MPYCGMTSFGFRVYGTPVPQGSKIPGVSSKTGKMFVREQGGKNLKTWREDVKQAALAARGAGLSDGVESAPHIATFAGPIRLHVDFYMPRPASVSPRKRPYPTVAPDLDKLVRGVGDALKAAGVYADDAQICLIHAAKRYANDSPAGVAGAWIVISEVPLEGTLL